MTLYWLGQAGFILRAGPSTLVIDPYLSDSLAVKYRGKEFTHERMMPAPIAPEELSPVDAVLCTHRHSDHMDPGTLPQVARCNPGCRFVVPRAERDRVASLGVPEAAIVGTDAGETVPFDGVSVEAIPSAHESVAVNEKGENLFLGYIVRAGGLTLYHSGDCVPYDGLEAALKARSIDVALLPINGRSAYLSERGIAGNFSLEESASLCRAAEIPLLLCHHFGMFAFNTVNEPEVREAIARIDRPRCSMAATGLAFLLGRA